MSENKDKLEEQIQLTDTFVDWKNKFNAHLDKARKWELQIEAVDILSQERDIRLREDALMYALVLG